MKYTHLSRHIKHIFLKSRLKIYNAITIYHQIQTDNENNYNRYYILRTLISGSRIKMWRIVRVNVFMLLERQVQRQ